MAEKKCLRNGCTHKRTSPFCDDCWTKRRDRDVEQAVLAERERIEKEVDAVKKMLTERLDLMTISHGNYYDGIITACEYIRRKIGEK